MAQIKKTINAKWLYLDVLKGRKTLVKRLEKGEKIHIKIDAYINDINSGDDGTSIEFECSVKSCEEVKK